MAELAGSRLVQASSSMRMKPASLRAVTADLHFKKTSPSRGVGIISPGDAIFTAWDRDGV